MANRQAPHLCDRAVQQVLPDQWVTARASLRNTQEYVLSIDLSRGNGGPERMGSGSCKALQDGAQAAE